MVRFGVDQTDPSRIRGRQNDQRYTVTREMLEKEVTYQCLRAAFYGSCCLKHRNPKLPELTSTGD